MAKSKIIHWHYGCRFGQPFFSPLLSAYQFLAEATTNPDWVCVTCAKAARLALAAESAPKADTRTDSDRYAELRKLVEAYQTAKSYNDDAPLQALRDWSHR